MFPHGYENKSKLARNSRGQKVKFLIYSFVNMRSVVEMFLVNFRYASVNPLLLQQTVYSTSLVQLVIHQTGFDRCRELNAAIHLQI